MMKDPLKFMENLNDYKRIIDEMRVPPANFAAIQNIINDPEFTPENLKTKAEAASGVCNWLQNINLYFDVVVNTEPKRQAVEKAKIDLAEANETKETMQALVAELQAKLDILLRTYQEAMDKKKAAEDDALRCETRLSRANRLVAALGSEKGRWGDAITQFTEDMKVVHGDVLLASSFVSYVGPFNKEFRDMIINDNFLKFFADEKIPMSAACDPVLILTDEATIASWNNDKLPSDRVSTENGSILTNSERFSLIIDPQL
jgi:dynein heavy chain